MYAGSAMAARMAMIATTIISSIRVKPCWFFMVYPLGLVGVIHVPRCPLLRSFDSRAALARAGVITQIPCQYRTMSFDVGF